MDIWPRALECGGIRAYDAAMNEVQVTDVAFGSNSDVVIDGSCTRPPDFAESARAGWAVTALDSEGRVTGTVMGPVWRPLPQTAQAAENCALAVLSYLAVGPIQPHGDCLPVVNAAKRPVKEQLSARRRYAGIRRSAIHREGHKFLKEPK
eukprot:2579119-Karenia_brevis.AAC.1